MSNYRAFGYTKLVPRVPADKFKAVISNSANADKALVLWEEVTLN